MRLLGVLSVVLLIGIVQAAVPNERIGGFCASVVLPPRPPAGAVDATADHCPRDDARPDDAAIMQSMFDEQSRFASPTARKAPFGSAAPAAPLCHNWMAPFYYDTLPAKGSIFNKTAALGRDFGWHYASALDDSHKMLATGFEKLPHLKDVIYTVDSTAMPQTRTPSTGSLQKCLSSISMVTIPQYPGGWHVALTAKTNNSFTGVYNVDVASAAIDPKVFQVPWTADPSGAHPARTVARVFFESSPQPSNFAFLLQPCNLAFPQQLVKLDLTTQQIFTTDLAVPENVCLHAPGMVFGNVFALATFGALGQKEQLVQINPDDGTVSILGDGPAGFSMSRCARDDVSMELTPYTYSYATQSLYAMSGNQRTLARFDLQSFTSTVSTWTPPLQCRRGLEIHSFAGILA